MAGFPCAVRGVADGASSLPGAVPPTARLGTGCWPSWSPMPTRPGSWSGTCLSTPRSPARTSTAPALRGRRRGRRPTQGAIPNDKSPGVGRDEPDDHGIGRSRGGLSTESHALVDGQGRLLTLIVGPGHAGDSPVLPLLLGNCGSRVEARDGRGPDRRCCARTRRTARAGTVPCCDHAGSRPSSPRRATRPPTANDAAAPAAARSPTTPRTTRTATSSNGSSTASSTGVPSPAATTSTPLSTADIPAAIVDWLKHLRDRA